MAQTGTNLLDRLVALLDPLECVPFLREDLLLPLCPIDLDALLLPALLPAFVFLEDLDLPLTDSDFPLTTPTADLLVPRLIDLLRDLECLLEGEGAFPVSNPKPGNPAERAEPMAPLVAPFIKLDTSPTSLPFFFREMASLTRQRMQQRMSNTRMRPMAMKRPSFMGESENYQKLTSYILNYKFNFLTLFDGKSTARTQTITLNKVTIRHSLQPCWTTRILVGQLGKGVNVILSKEVKLPISDESCNNGHIKLSARWSGALVDEQLVGSVGAHSVEGILIVDGGKA